MKHTHYSTKVSPLGERAERANGGCPRFRIHNLSPLSCVPAFLSDENDTLPLLNGKYRLAMMGWNLALLPAQARFQLVANILGEMPADARLEIKETLQYLVERKDALFADYTWFVHTFHLEPKGTGVVLYIAAASSLGKYTR